VLVSVCVCVGVQRGEYYCSSVKGFSQLLRDLVLQVLESDIPFSSPSLILLPLPPLPPPPFSSPSLLLHLLLILLESVLSDLSEVTHPTSPLATTRESRSSLDEELQQAKGSLQCIF